MRTTSEFWLRGAVFRHVTLKGRVGGMIVRGAYWPGDPGVKEAFAQANDEFYKTVDWALDISEANFTADVELSVVPGHLIIRDPETQILVTQRRLLENNAWMALRGHPSGWGIELTAISNTPNGNGVLVAPKKASFFKENMQAIEFLREHDLVEPDDAMPSRN